MVPLVANVALLLADAFALLWLRRRPAALVPLALPVVAAGATGIAGALFGWRIFAMAQCLSWAIFLHTPLILLASRRKLPALVAAILTLVGIDAFLVEPRWLEVTHTRIHAPTSLRIALVADLQTDHFGAHERAAIAALKAENPDLVLFAGDYVQTADNQVFADTARAINAALQGLAPPLGAIAVRGDVDAEQWQMIFDGLPVTVVKESRTIDLGPVVVTALDPREARSGHAHVPKVDKYHIVLAHPPDFALSQPDANLLVAGHVHGGQVRLPVIGPLMTLSKVPRAWAVGHTSLAWGPDLYVSRGIGMERFDAPRIRFLCRPELAILELAP